MRHAHLVGQRVELDLFDRYTAAEVYEALRTGVEYMIRDTESVTSGETDLECLFDLMDIFRPWSPMEIEDRYEKELSLISRKHSFNEELKSERAKNL